MIVRVLDPMCRFAIFFSILYFDKNDFGSMTWSYNPEISFPSNTFFSFSMNKDLAHIPLLEWSNFQDIYFKSSQFHMSRFCLIYVSKNFERTKKFNFSTVFLKGIKYALSSVPAYVHEWCIHSSCTSALYLKQCYMQCTAAPDIQFAAPWIASWAGSLAFFWCLEFWDRKVIIRVRYQMLSKNVTITQHPTSLVVFNMKQ